MPFIINGSALLQEVFLTEIRNPNQSGGGGGDSRTLLIFTAVFFLMFLGFQIFGPKKPQEPAPPAPTPVAKSSSSETPAASPAATAPGAAPAGNSLKSQASGTKAPGAAAANVVAASTENTTVVENELYRITFSNRGGQVVSWILKKYKDESGKPLDLVNRAAAAKYGYPLSLWTSDPGLRKTLDDALFVPSATGDLIAPATLTYRLLERRPGGEEGFLL